MRLSVSVHQWLRIKPTKSAAVFASDPRKYTNGVRNFSSSTCGLYAVANGTSLRPRNHHFRLPPNRSHHHGALSYLESPSELFSSTMSPTTSAVASDEYRLPTNVKPTHYDLTIKTDLENLTFQGFVKISLDVKHETSQVILHTSELELGEASVYSDSLDVEQVPTGNSLNSAQERITYQLSKPLPANSKAQLKIYFGGKLTGSMMGYYKSAWEHEGKTKNYALTQFEPTAARRAFPCWDEPLLKATFGVTLISRAQTINLSNMPVISEDTLGSGAAPASVTPEIASIIPTSTPNDQWKITKFQVTPPMSSYIVAFANGEFKYLEKSVVMPLSGKTIPLRIYATADVIHQAQFALDVKASVLPLYEQVFEVEYPLPKLDTLVASDFDAGAMENWGLITGRTSAFLLDPEKADLRAKKQIASTQSHEVAHMWFGNITTMEWWNYLYLNEGFATLMGEVIIAVFPEWKVDSEFISDHLNRALNLDAKLSSHPIEVDCPDANDINQIFDSLSYSKAASVLRMLSNYVGEDKFLKGVSLYLKKKLYANSVTSDLWDGISTATSIDINNLMENWISKIGFPVLTVTESANGIKVRQDRFLETGLSEPKDNETIWNVPLSVLSTGTDGKSTIDKTIVLSDREKEYAIDTSKPFKLNAGTTGVYRVLYTPERLSKIAAEATKEDSIFSLNDRLGLVQDAMALSKAGLLKLSGALTLVDIFKNEKEYLVWSGISESLSNVASIWWEHPVIVDQINAFRRALFVPIVKRLGYEYSKSDTPDITSLRTSAITQAAQAGDEEVINELKGRFQHFMKTDDDSQIPADLQRITFNIAVKHGGKEEYDAIVKIYGKPRTPTSRIAAMVAMGVTQDPVLLDKTFDFTLNKSRDQDIIYFFAGLGTNTIARRPLSRFLRDQYNVLLKRFEGNFTLQYLVTYSNDFLSTEKDLKELEDFFKDKDTSKYSRSLAQTLDTIRAKVAYIDRSTEDLEQWLASWKKGKL